MVFKRSEHVHKYERVKLGKHVVLKCMLSGCVHYINKALAEARLCVCWRCNEPFTLTKASIKLVRPHCIACTKGKKKEKLDMIKEYLEKAVGE